ncbi:acyl-CoA/acyl-ACP dehydrogenase [Streptomyces roseirectus]|uniref:Acyl-CoA/acyl-ACP dehydrogenase n=1 Tax=Streptomyces roseirectus TaxID=2768066 RepID=A0A7H0I6T3_9ACTN|nr:acyl-CoA dehydrogenase family protein [Streptomyces roseirectus]QNP68499.1 acyl-CoA/acyl-ACP dehydrogenase [Streptomyces roseirectus]
MEHPLLVQARRLAAEVLVPHAERVEREGVPVGHVEAVKRAGVLGVNAPVEYGGSGASAGVGREVAEVLAGACCSTWFVQTQHHTPVRTLVRGEAGVRERLLGPLARGELLSGVAYAHLRAYPRRPVRVVDERGGVRFDGRVPWFTGWGLNDVMLLAGVTDGGEVVFAFVEARERAGLRASEPLRLAALEGARTVSLELDGLWVGEEAVASRVPYEEWAREDRAKAANANPAVFGIAGAALELAGMSTERWADVRGRAYALADDPNSSPDERLAVKVEAFQLMQTATTAAVVAGGGRSMLLGSKAQRLAREGLFLLVQAQTAQSRTAHLNALAHPGTAPFE